MFKFTTKGALVWLFFGHLSIIPMFMYAGLQEWIIAFIAIEFFGTISIGVILHRLISHRSYKCPKWVEYVGSIIASLGPNGSTIGWAAVHRAHHRYADTKDDPHSPEHVGLLKVQMNIGFPVRLQLVPDLLRSKFHVFLHNYYWLINLIAIIVFFLIDPFSIVYAYFFPILVYWHLANFLNIYNHKFGYRNYETKDNSRNSLFTGYLLNGEGWHNNHHAHPGRPKHGEKWWEFDVVWLIIKMIRIKDSK